MAAGAAHHGPSLKHGRSSLLAAKSKKAANGATRQQQIQQKILQLSDAAGGAGGPSGDGRRLPAADRNVTSVLHQLKHRVDFNSSAATGPRVRAPSKRLSSRASMHKNAHSGVAQENHPPLQRTFQEKLIRKA